MPDHNVSYVMCQIMSDISSLAMLVLVELSQQNQKWVIPDAYPMRSFVPRLENQMEKGSWIAPPPHSQFVSSQTSIHCPKYL